MSKIQKTDSILWINEHSENNYSDKSQYREHIVEQYKLYVEMADRISSRRDKANAFFLTLNGVLLSAGVPLLDKFSGAADKWMLIFPLAVVFLQLFFWWRLILSYKQLNGAKFKIIGLMEEKLPASPYGKAEWDNLLEEGKVRKVYWPLTHLESKIPGIFLLAYIVLVVVFLIRS